MKEEYKNTIIILYEIVMLVLVSVSVISIFISEDPNPVFVIISKVVWGIFLIDITVRIVRAASRWKYVVKNPFDIVAVIPLEEIFLFARFARVIKLFRYKNLIKRYLVKIDNIVKGYSILKISITTLIGLLIISIIVYINEDLSYISTLIWVIRNFLQFNFFSEITSISQFNTILSIIIKVYGLLYMGILLNHVWILVMQKVKDYRATKTKNKEEYNLEE